MNSIPSEIINALPMEVRDYIMWLETNADPGHTLQDNYRLTQENAYLRASLNEWVEGKAKLLWSFSGHSCYEPIKRILPGDEE